MRCLITSALIAICYSSTALPQDEDKRPSPYRCLYEGQIAGVERMASTGNRWLDSRIGSEHFFLKSLFRLDAKIVLLGEDAPRDAFVQQNSEGKATVYFKGPWLKKTCTKRKHHNTARVAYILAHQYAHALQAKMGCTLPEIARERHADMLAGWFRGRRNIATLKGKPPMNASFAPHMFPNVVEYMNERYEHGTAEMRAKALAEGFKAWRADRLSLSKT